MHIHIDSVVATENSLFCPTNSWTLEYEFDQNIIIHLANLGRQTIEAPYVQLHSR